MGEKFFESVFHFSDLYRSVFIDRDIITEEAEAIRYHNLIHIMDTEFVASEWRACLLSYVEKFAADRLLDFLYRLEKVYLAQWMGGVRKDERYSIYTGILQSIEKAKKAADVLQEMKFDADVIRSGVTNSKLYNVGYAKYALLRLELIASEQDQRRRVEARSIEHVLPQEPKAGSDWLKTHVKTEIPLYVHSVGNLVLLSKPKNSSASNREFADKVGKYLAPRMTDYLRSMQVTKATEWTRKTIEDRTATAAKEFLEDL